MSQTITISIEVPISEIDFSACTVRREREFCEFWGMKSIETTYDGDLSGATWQGHAVEFSELDYLITDGRVAA
ncbi:MAG: hypothetical protein KDI33_04490 [Halioglobus sp.]|nr:hypothetical protein [Halioglobus sp.]